MTIINEELEKCEECGRIVHIDLQYCGLCHECIEEKDLGSCSACGELFQYEELMQDQEHNYRCDNCRKIEKRRGEES